MGVDCQSQHYHEHLAAAESLLDVTRDQFLKSPLLEGAVCSRDLDNELEALGLSQSRVFKITEIVIGITEISLRGDYKGTKIKSRHHPRVATRRQPRGRTSLKAGYP